MTILNVRAVDREREVAELRRRLDECAAELAEARAQQTATAEVLQVINSSPGDLAPVFDAMLQKAMRLCEAALGVLWIFDGEAFHLAASHGAPPSYAEFLAGGPRRPGPATAHGRLVRGSPLEHITDVAASEDYRLGDPFPRALVDLAGGRTILAVPLRKGASFLGDIFIYRQEVRPFSDKQIALLQNFAAQAVIAMENARLLTETREALEQQTATAEVLQVINSSPGDLAPVFDAMLEKAMHLCDAAFGILLLAEADTACAVALRNVPAAFVEFFTREPLRLDPDTFLARALQQRSVMHITDSAAGDPYKMRAPLAVAAVELGGIRTMLMVPMIKDGHRLGLFTIYRQEVRPFSDKQIALLQNFAAQAVIAMENARLLTETREALEQQTATAEVLQVINSSPGDLAPVFEAMLEKAIRLCEAAFGSLWTYDGECLHAVAVRNVPAELAEFVRQPHAAGPNTPLGRVVRTKELVSIADLATDEMYRSGDRWTAAPVELGGARSYLAIPLLKDDALVGAFAVSRREVRPFSDKQIALVQNFAAQAVIAMENARLITETREALEYQTAISDVLKVISGSAFDLAPVLETVVTTAVRLCRADQAVIYRNIEGEYRWAAGCSLAPEYERIEREIRIRPGAGSLVGRAALEGRTVQILDAWTDPLYEAKADARVGGVHTMLGVPLLRDGVPVGVIGLARRRIEAYTEKEIGLVTTFADQAVIAIENTRLLTELREALEQQTATAEVLQVINSSPGDLAPVFDAMLEKAIRLCDAAFGVLHTFDGHAAYAVALRSVPKAFEEYLTTQPLRFDPQQSFMGRAISQQRTIHIADNAAEEPYRSGLSTAVAAVELGGIRSLLHVPLIKDDGVLGVFTVFRQEVRPFTEKQIALLQNFASQAVIAIENARLLTEIRAARDAAETALRELQTAQASLVHAQKMAALGQLTAGIAHEIKNPLNFVNNFAGLSIELLDELKETAQPAITALGDDQRAELDEIVATLTGNLDKIAQHGRRADGIVKSMLAHSRGGSGEREAVDINVLVDEALNLAYHGARAQDQNFQVTLERDFGRNVAAIELVPQDITRVLLNLFGNGFYATSKRRDAVNEAKYEPRLRVRTRDCGVDVEIRIRDNGEGIAPEIKDRLFQPFFTTKPTGEGTGLGLSISYDIVTQQHGGTITVESRLGDFTEFTIRLPRRSAGLGSTTETGGRAP